MYIPGTWNPVQTVKSVSSYQATLRVILEYDEYHGIAKGKSPRNTFHTLGDTVQCTIYM
jgi:hypothetical protein